MAFRYAAKKSRMLNASLTPRKATQPRALHGAWCGVRSRSAVSPVTSVMTAITIVDFIAADIGAITSVQRMTRRQVPHAQAANATAAYGRARDLTAPWPASAGSRRAG